MEGKRFGVTTITDRRYQYKDGFKVELDLLENFSDDPWCMIKIKCTKDDIKTDEELQKFIKHIYNIVGYNISIAE